MKVKYVDTLRIYKDMTNGNTYEVDDFTTYSNYRLKNDKGEYIFCNIRFFEKIK